MEPEDVFTPKTIVSREMFARRNEPDLMGEPGLQSTLEGALRERGGQVLVYGDTGVGKSSLVKYAAEDQRMPVVGVECLGNKSYEDLIEDALRKLVETEEIERTRTASVGAEAELGQKMPWLLSFKGKIRGDYASARKLAVVKKPPLDALLEAMKAANARLLVLDNFQNIADQRTRLLVAQTMEFLSDRAADTGDIKMVVIGIADDAHSLLAGSGSFSRRTTEVGVPRMPDDEIAYILRRGFGFLGLELQDQLLDQMLFWSDGFPYFAHLLGLHTARVARAENHGKLTQADADRGVKRAVQQVERSYPDRLERAYEAGGQVQPRRRILRLLSRSGDREWRYSDVAEAYEQRYGARADYTFLNVALGQLITPAYGSILKRTGRKPYAYKFADPHMRPYLRLNPPAGT